MFFFLSKFVPSMTFNMYWLHHSINLLKIVPFLGGWLSDRLLGDPEGWPHPIVWFGKAISAGEKELNKGSERVLKGGILAVVLILGVYLICERILSWAWIIHPQFSGLLTAVGVFYCLSGKTLIKEVKAVFEAVDRSTEEGRRQVARIVGRDTSNLSPQEIRAAALETLWYLREKAGADSAGCAHYNVTPDGEQRTELLLPAGIYEETGIREKILWPLAGDRLQPPVFNGFIWRFLFDAAILRDNAITFEGAYLEDELFLMEYFANVHRLAVTDKPLYRYLENPASATHRYMRDYPAVFARFLERKAEIVEKYGLDAARPQWRANTVWAGLLIAVGNEYVKSNPKPVREKRKAVEALCAQPEFAKAIRELRPKGLGRNKQIVADLIGSGRFGTLTALYRLKNRM